jgi:hypothetical protein
VEARGDFRFGDEQEERFWQSLQEGHTMFRRTLGRKKLGRAALAAVAFGIIWAGCSRDQIDTTGPRGPEILNQDLLRPAMAVQERHTNRLLAIPGVVGTAVGLDRDGRAVIRVFTARPGVAGLPAVLDGLPVESKVTGMFVAFSDPTTRFDRPVPTGVSTGHPAVTAGTIAARVKDASGNVYALSNNHVYANQNDANIGDPGLQPGAYDGGQDPADRIGTLSDFQPIDFNGGNNTIDAAIVLSSTSILGNSTPTDDGYGTPSSTTVTAYIGQPVQKYGRTTGLTHGEVSDLNATVNVCYEVLWIFCMKQATFVGQIGITPGGFSGGGDSGSLIVTDDGNNHPVALLFAGSDTYTLANPIDAVLSRFHVTIDDSSPLPPDPVTDIAISDVSAPTSATQGDLVSVSVRVNNVGNQEVASSFALTLTDDTDGLPIGTQTVDGLGIGSFTVLTFEWSTETASLGDHVLTAAHDFPDDNPGNDSNSTTVTLTEEPVGASGMHVGDLFPYSSSEGRTWSGYVIVRIHDQNHDPILGATVYGSWSGGGLAVDECTTDYAGECLMLSTLNAKKTKSLTFTVTDVDFGSATYSPSDNHDADGDSDGTSITINKP